MPATFVNTARKRFPLSESCAPETVSVSCVAPAIGVNVLPPSLDDSHCTVGSGCPLASASKVAVPPVSTTCDSGCSVILGKLWTVRVAAELVAEPAMLLQVARKR